MATSSNPSSNKYQGFLFFNSQKNNDNYPDVSGKLTLDGKEWSVAAWERVKDNKKFLVVSAKPKDNNAPTNSANRSQTRPAAAKTSSNTRSSPQPQPQHSIPVDPAPLSVPNGLPNSPFGGGISRSANTVAVEPTPQAHAHSDDLPPPPFPSFPTGGAPDSGKDLDFDDIFKEI